MRGSYGDFGDFGSLQYGGFWSNLFNTSWGSDWQAQIDSAKVQIDAARTGKGITDWREIGNVHNAQTQSPSNTHGAYLRNAFWLAVVARLGIGYGISASTISSLGTAAGDNWAQGKTGMSSTSSSAIQSRLEAVIPYFKAAQVAGVPFAALSPIYQTYANMVDAQSIAFRQSVVEMQSFKSLVLKPTGSTLYDVGKLPGTLVGGAADIAQGAGDFAKWLMKWGPWIVAGIGGVVVISAVAKVARRE